MSADGGDLIVNGDRIKVYAVRNPAEIPWGAHDVDVVLECTCLFASKAKSSAHLAGGAKKVIISSPGDKDVDGTFVYGVNHDKLTAAHQVISMPRAPPTASRPLAKALHEKLGIEHGLLTTIHAYTNDQVLTDVYHADLRRARSATMFADPDQDGCRSRCRAGAPRPQREIGWLLHARTDDQRLVRRPDVRRLACDDQGRSGRDYQGSQRRRTQGRAGLQHRAAVSIDFNHNPLSSVYDATQTRVMQGTMVKVLSWYDNEWVSPTACWT